ncbi:hypothetical protein ACN47E_005915 [Coniothyrium glycines]
MIANPWGADSAEAAALCLGQLMSVIGWKRDASLGPRVTAAGPTAATHTHDTAARATQYTASCCLDAPVLPTAIVHDAAQSPADRARAAPHAAQRTWILIDTYLGTYSKQKACGMPA